MTLSLMIAMCLLAAPAGEPARLGETADVASDGNAAMLNGFESSYADLEEVDWDAVFGDTQPRPVTSTLKPVNCIDYIDSYGSSCCTTIEFETSYVWYACKHCYQCNTNQIGGCGWREHYCGAVPKPNT